MLNSFSQNNLFRECRCAVKETFMKFYDIQIMSAIDFTSSFWQIKLAGKDEIYGVYNKW